MTSCGPFKYKKVDARDIPTRGEDRVKKNIEEGRAFRLQDTLGGKKGGTFDFASSNELWRASLDTIDFMPLISASYSGGTIITDWYTSASNENERCKLNIFINGYDLKTENLKVSSFCQIFKNQKWINTKTNIQNNVKIENAILNKAKKIRLKTG